MPQARSAGTTPKATGAKPAAAKRAPAKKPAAAKTTAAKTTAAKPAAAKRTAAKPAAAKPAAAKPAAKRAPAKKPAAARSTAAKATNPAEARLEAAATRLRKLNERIIEASRDAGESTLTSYEKALKSIASGLEKGPGRSDVEWIANLATAQAKFIRELTDSWTSAARGMLK
jgi:hypothetical protein